MTLSRALARPGGDFNAVRRASIFAACFALVACQTVGVRSQTTAAHRLVVDGLTLKDGASATHREVVSLLGLDRECARATPTCAQRLLDAPGTVRPAIRALASAETQYRVGRRSRGDAQLAAWRDCARQTHSILFQPDLAGRGGALEARSQLALWLYNDCVGGLVDAMSVTVGLLTMPVRWDVPADRFPVEAVTQISRADRLAIDGLRTRQFADGLGVAAVASGHTTPAGGAFPPQPFALPITVRYVVEPGGAEVLVVTDASTRRSVNTAWGPVRLARDPSAAYAVAAHAFEAELSRWDSFRGVDLPPDALIRVLAPIDPSKVPVILIHGVGSSPLTWANAVNELQGDPDIAQHYQFWLARYSTGLPMLVNRQRLAAKLIALRGKGTLAPGTPAVLIGHSMGGVLARLLVTDSGDHLWDATFTAAPDQLHAAPEDVAAARVLLFFEALPDVDTVVFIATPHGGSQVADGLLGHALGQLIHMPEQTLGFLSRLVRGDARDVQPALLASVANDGLTSVATLSPSQPVIQTARRLPVREGVQVHSIIGIRNAARPDVGDGVVPLASARWPVGSEDQIAGGHNLHTEPATILLLKQMLLARLQRSGAAEAP